MVVKIDRSFISLFGGIGGFDLAFVRQGWNCIGFYEIDKYAVQTYNKNFKTDYRPTDITKLDAGSVPDHTLLCGGFPCQAFSIAGKRRGFEDTRGTLFFEIMRIARAKRTPYLLLENVKGLLNHDSGKTFEIILRTQDECG
jgi:DNA (cytosine-5)-methyltransferase 1